jgi:hypothetical protein
VSLPSWHHFCFDLDFDSGEVTVTKNNQVITGNGTAMLVDVMVNSTQQLAASMGQQGTYLWINYEVPDQ